MARFPQRKAEISTLVQDIITGLEGNPDFPNPPIAAAALQGLLDHAIALKEAQVAAMQIGWNPAEDGDGGKDAEPALPGRPSFPRSLEKTPCPVRNPGPHKPISSAKALPCPWQSRSG